MIEREDREGIAILRINHGKVNALDAELLHEIVRAVADVESSDARGAVITGTGKVFSAGADLLRVLAGGASYIDESLPVLSRAFESLFTFPRPLVAAVNGHAIAGGAIIAFTADYRVMAAGKGRIGVSELAVGVPYPVSALEIVRFAVEPRHVQPLVYFGETYIPEQAKDMGLVDEIADPDEVLERAVAVAGRLAAIPPASFAHVKHQLRRPVVERIVRDAPMFDRRAARIWASPAATEAISSFVQSLGKR